MDAGGTVFLRKQAHHAPLSLSLSLFAALRRPSALGFPRDIGVTVALVNNARGENTVISRIRAEVAAVFRAQTGSARRPDVTAAMASKCGNTIREYDCSIILPPSVENIALGESGTFALI
jgi:hypothetical protein